MNTLVIVFRIEKRMTQNVHLSHLLVFGIGHGLMAAVLRSSIVQGRKEIPQTGDKSGHLILSGETVEDSQHRM
jgi:hypothetical protein